MKDQELCARFLSEMRGLREYAFFLRILVRRRFCSQKDGKGVDLAASQISGMITNSRDWEIPISPLPFHDHGVNVLKSETEFLGQVLLPPISALSSH